MRLKIILVWILLVSLIALTVNMQPVSSSPEYGPRTDNLLIHIYSNPDAENYALELGEIDINDWPLTKTWVDSWAGNPDIQMKDYAGFDMFNFDLNNQRWPTGVTVPRDLDPCSGTYKHYTTTSEWDDEAESFRKAIAYLTDKDRYISEILKGYGYRIDSKVPVPGLGGFVPPDLPMYEYDPCEAAAEFDANGFIQGTTPNPYYDPGFPCSAEYMRIDPRTGEDLECLEMYIRLDIPTEMAAGEMLCDALRKSGICVNAHITERTVCYTKVMIEYDYHIYTSDYVVGPDIDYLELLFHSCMYYGGSETSYYDGVGWSPNYVGFCNHEYDEWAEELSYATTAEEIKEAAFMCQRVFAQDVGSIPVWTRAGVKAYRTGWEGVVNMDGCGVDNYWSFLNMYNPIDDRIDWGFKSNLEALHVICSTEPWDWKALGLIYDSLIGRNPYKIVEEYDWLVTYDVGPDGVRGTADDVPGWSIGSWADGTTVTFTLREAIMWHDGAPLTPEDVKFSLEFTRDCGPGVAWNYASACDIDHVDTQAEDPSLGPLDVKVYFTCASCWAIHWAGGIPIINKDLWMTANDVYGWGYGTPDWDPMLVRDYHLWNDDVNENGVIDLCEDGTGAWVYDSTDNPAAIGASTWVLLTANRAFYKTQTEISDYLSLAFHRIGDADYDGVIYLLDLSMICKAYGTDTTYPWGTDWGEYNPDADLNSNGEVDIWDLDIACASIGRKADCPAPQVDSPTTIYVDPMQSGATTVGETFSVNITISNAKNVHGWQAWLCWDPTLLDVTDVTEGQFLKDAPEYETKFRVLIHNTQGLAKIGCSRYSESGSPGAPPGKYGNGTLATVAFQVKRIEGACTLDLRKTKLVDPHVHHHSRFYNSSISHMAEDGYFYTPGTVQADIFEAVPGSTVQVYAGTYREQITIDRPLTLIGEDPKTTIIDGSGTGDVMTAIADNVVITRFMIRNGTNGIKLDHSNYNTIYNNTIRDNSETGITLLHSDGSTIFHNNFINNPTQVSGHESSNTWDNGKWEGNYWSDYTGEDVDIPLDGIGDTLLPHLGVDHYPLINPYRYLQGDVDLDGDVDILDLYMIARALGTDTTWPWGKGWDKYNPHADLNCDGRVNVFDLYLSGRNYGETADC